jgi:hypothetical protein
MEQEKILPEKQKELMQQRFDQLLADKLKIKSLSALPRTLPDETDEIPDVERWR